VANDTFAAQTDAAIRDRYDASPEAHTMREMCKADFKFFYVNVLDQLKRGLGRVHDFYIDFKRLHELDQIPYQHSTIAKHLPERDSNGDYKVRWLYYPTLETDPPQIQDGDEGPISEMYQERFWRGMLLRIAGDGQQKCELLPRGHLKTELGVSSYPMWEMIRDPSLRHIIRCESHPLAAGRVGQIQEHFDSNEKLQKLFGDLRPSRAEAKVWNQKAMQLVCKKRRGREPTLMASGITGSVVGFHFDRIILDDVVGESNIQTPESLQKVCEKVDLMTFLGDPGHHFTDVGTVWADGDAHSLMTRMENPGFARASFVIATIRDADDKLIWPAYTEKQHDLARSKCRSDFNFYCQYYNQPRMGAQDNFDTEWINWYNEDGRDNPVRVATEKKLSIVMTVDPASSVGKQSDYTACIVQGQTDDGKARYLLDGIYDRLPPHDLVARVAEMACKWQDICADSGTQFRLGIETFGFQTYVKTSLRDHLRTLGRYIEVEELTPKRRQKVDRIKALITPFQAGRYYLPCTLMKTSLSGAVYDLIQAFYQEFTRFPSGLHDDLLDAMAYAAEMFRALAAPDNYDQHEDIKQKDHYDREDALLELEQEELFLPSRKIRNLINGESYRTTAGSCTGSYGHVSYPSRHRR